MSKVVRDERNQLAARTRAAMQIFYAADRGGLGGLAPYIDGKVDRELAEEVLAGAMAPACMSDAVLLASALAYTAGLPRAGHRQHKQRKATLAAASP